MSVASLHARPKNVIPAGSVPRVYPIGTLIAGQPVVGENSWLLSPCGVLRSPISRGGLLHVGYTNASSFSPSIVLSTAARSLSRYSVSALHSADSGPCSLLSFACSRLRRTLG